MIDLRKDTDSMTASQFRASYGVPVVSLGETRETLAMQREALRDVYGDNWRDALEEITAEEWNDESEESAIADEGERESLSLIRGYSARLTYGDWDGDTIEE
jgi:hypothetical protein